MTCDRIIIFGLALAVLLISGCAQQPPQKAVGDSNDQGDANAQKSMGETKPAETTLATITSSQEAEAYEAQVKYYSSPQRLPRGICPEFVSMQDKYYYTFWEGRRMLLGQDELAWIIINCQETYVPFREQLAAS